SGSKRPCTFASKKFDILAGSLYDTYRFGTEPTPFPHTNPLGDYRHVWDFATRVCSGYVGDDSDVLAPGDGLSARVVRSRDAGRRRKVAARRAAAGHGPERAEAGAGGLAEEGGRAL